MHEHKQDQALRPEYKAAAKSRPRYNPAGPTEFDEQCLACQRIETSSVRLRVPSVLFFLGNEGRQSDSLVAELDVCYSQFGERNVQLLVLADEKPSLLSQRLNLTIPIMKDNGLGALYLARPVLDDSSHAAVILGNDGLALHVLRKFPCEQPALPILGQIDRLRARFPDLFSLNKSRPSPSRSTKAGLTP